MRTPSLSVLTKESATRASSALESWWSWAWFHAFSRAMSMAVSLEFWAIAQVENNNAQANTRAFIPHLQSRGLAESRLMGWEALSPGKAKVQVSEGQGLSGTKREFTMFGILAMKSAIHSENENQSRATNCRPVGVS